MSWTGVAIGGATVVSGYLSSKASGDAADASAGASDRATEEQRRQYDLTRNDLSPFLDAGTSALVDFRQGLEQSPTAPQLEQFSFDPNSVLDNPNFQFLRDQGNIAQDRVAAKNRNLGSGNRLLEAQKFGQGLSTNFLNSEFNQQRTLNQDNNNRLLQQHSLGLQSFNDRLNRLGGLIDTGRGTGSVLGQIGADSASNIGKLQQNAGNAQAAGILGQSNALTNTINQGVQLYGSGAFNQPTYTPQTSSASVPGYTPIGAGDAAGFFS